MRDFLRASNQMERETLERASIMEEPNFDIRNSLCEGVSKVAKVVGNTLGTNGGVVLINNKPTKDGVTVAKAVKLVNPYEDIAAKLTVEAANKTAMFAGDGTTTTALIVDYLVSNLKETKGNPYKIQKGMLKGLAYIKEFIAKEKKEVDRRTLYNIAYTASNNNEDIAKSIQLIYDKLSDWGINVMFYKSDSPTDQVSVEFGYSISDSCPLIETRTIYDESYVICVDYKINMLGADLGASIIKGNVEKKPVIFICRDYAPSFIKDIKLQSARYSIPMHVVRVDMFGRHASGMFEDIACYTGATVLSETSVTPVTNLASICGGVKTVILSSTGTLLQAYKEAQPYIKAKIEELEDIMDEEKDKTELSYYNQRKNKLEGTVANYYVGGATIQELNERHDRVEDAVLAIRAAVLHGTMLGGGVTYLKAQHYLRSIFVEDKEESIGYKLIVDSLSYPFIKLCENNYYDQKQIEEIRNYIEKNDFSCIYNFNTSKYEFGDDITIMDTAATLTVVYEGAISVAHTINTTKAIILKDEQI